MGKRSISSRGRLLLAALFALVAISPSHANNPRKQEQFEAFMQHRQLNLLPDNTNLSRSAKLFGSVSATVLSGSSEETSFDDLRERDVYLLIDHTSSMMRPDCPGGTTRWDWLRREVLALSEELNQQIKGSISLVPFAKDFSIYTRVDSTQMKSILKRIVPAGSTHPENALDKVFEAYFAEREKNPTSVRPLLVVVLSDGVPNEPDALIDVIFKTTSRMIDRREIVLTFLQISNDEQGSSILDELDNDLVRNSEARYDIINKRTFRELRSRGLKNCLVEAFDESVQEGPWMISNASRK